MNKKTIYSLALVACCLIGQKIKTDAVVRGKLYNMFLDNVQNPQRYHSPHKSIMPLYMKVSSLVDDITGVPETSSLVTHLQKNKNNGSNGLEIRNGSLNYSGVILEPKLNKDKLLGFSVETHIGSKGPYDKYIVTHRPILSKDRNDLNKVSPPASEVSSSVTSPSSSTPTTPVNETGRSLLSTTPGYITPDQFVDELTDLIGQLRVARARNNEVD